MEPQPPQQQQQQQPVVKRYFGWVKQKPDPRDVKYCAVSASLKTLPPKVDLRSVQQQPAIFDQGQLGSCTANATVFAHQFDDIQQLGSHVSEAYTGSRLFVYYGAREIEGTTQQDSGCAIRDAVKVLNQKGVCMEAVWPYDVRKFTQKPPVNAYTQALEHQVLGYAAVQPNVTAIKQALVDGHPVVFGFQVYSSFNNIGANGLMPVPNPKTEQLQGGHAVAAVGYDDAIGCFIVRNSWGDRWGDKGYFYMPYAVISNGLGADFWVLTKVEVIGDGPTPDPTPNPIDKKAILALLDTIDAAHKTINTAKSSIENASKQIRAKLA